jgi:hypothetical protein
MIEEVEVVPASIIIVIIKNFLEGSWAPVHRPNEYLLARQLPKLACIWVSVVYMTALAQLHKKQ